MNAKEIFINLGNNVEIPINEDLEKALLKDTPGYKVIQDYIEQLEKEVELKDKALDKACKFIEEIAMRKEWKGIPQCEKCDYLNNPGVCWDCEGNLKKMFEGLEGSKDE